MREPDDNSVEMDVEEALPWVKDILSAIEAEEWERAQYLLALRTALNADASSAFSQERSSLLDDYSRQLHLLRLSDVDSLDLVNRLQRMTFGMLIKDVVS
jgi:hypothetical protein